MRSSITLFDDQYSLYKAFKSKKLLIAFVEFMFEDIEPKNLNEKEQSVFNSLRERMTNSKQKHDGNSKGWATSHWWWRKGNTSSKAQTINKSKTTQKQLKNNEEEEEDILSNDNILKEEEEDKEKKKIIKKKFLDFVLLSEDEHQKLIERFGTTHTNQLIDRLNNYIWSTWKRYKSHYYTILNRSKNESVTTTQSQAELMKERERQRIREEAQEILNRNKNTNGQSIQNKWVDRRTSIAGC